MSSLHLPFLIPAQRRNVLAGIEPQDRYLLCLCATAADVPNKLGAVKRH